MRRPGQPLSIIELGKMRKFRVATRLGAPKKKKDEGHLQVFQQIFCSERNLEESCDFLIQIGHVRTWLTNSTEDLGHRSSLLLEGKEAGKLMEFWAQKVCFQT
jgi:hypothetical protein